MAQANDLDTAAKEDTDGDIMSGDATTMNFNKIINNNISAFELNNRLIELWYNDSQVDNRLVYDFIFKSNSKTFNKLAVKYSANEYYKKYSVIYIADEDEIEVYKYEVAMGTPTYTWNTESKYKNILYDTDPTNILIKSDFTLSDWIKKCFVDYNEDGYTITPPELYYHEATFKESDFIQNLYTSTDTEKTVIYNINFMSDNIEYNQIKVEKDSTDYLMYFVNSEISTYVYNYDSSSGVNTWNKPEYKKIKYIQELGLDSLETKIFSNINSSVRISELINYLTIDNNNASYHDYKKCELAENRFGTANGNYELFVNYKCKNTFGLDSSFKSLLFKVNAEQAPWQKAVESCSLEEYTCKSGSTESNKCMPLACGYSPGDISLCSSNEHNNKYTVSSKNKLFINKFFEHSGDDQYYDIIIFKTKTKLEHDIIVISADNNLTVYGVCEENATIEICGIECKNITVEPAFKELGYVPNRLGLFIGGAGGSGSKPNKRKELPTGGGGGAIGLLIINLENLSDSLFATTAETGYRIRLGKYGVWTDDASKRYGQDSILQLLAFTSITSPRSLDCFKAKGGKGGSRNGAIGSGGKCVCTDTTKNIAYWVVKEISGGDSATYNNEVIPGTSITEADTTLFIDSTKITGGNAGTSYYTTTVGNVTIFRGGGGGSLGCGGRGFNGGDKAEERVNMCGYLGSGGGAGDCLEKNTPIGGRGWCLIFY